MTRLGRAIVILLLLGLLSIPRLPAAAQAPSASSPFVPGQQWKPTRFHFRSGGTSLQLPRTEATGPIIPVGGNPVDVAANPATHTAYITNGNDGTVSVVDTAHCRAGDTSGCQSQWPVFAVGNGPVNDAVNPVTDTLYVTNIGDNTVSVINGNTCNASIRSNCAQTLLTVGPNPDYVIIDVASNTIYVVNDNLGGPGTVSVINGNQCDAADLSGCGRPPTSVLVGANPIGLAFDPVNHTVYIANCGAGGGGSCTASGTVSMIDAARCNAVTTTGCSQNPPTVDVARRWLVRLGYQEDVSGRRVPGGRRVRAVVARATSSASSG